MRQNQPLCRIYNQIQMEKYIYNDGTQWSIVHSITGTSSVTYVYYLFYYTICLMQFNMTQILSFVRLKPVLRPIVNRKITNTVVRPDLTQTRNHKENIMMLTWSWNHRPI